MGNTQTICAVSSQSNFFYILRINCCRSDCPGIIIPFGRLSCLVKQGPGFVFHGIRSGKTVIQLDSVNRTTGNDYFPILTGNTEEIIFRRAFRGNNLCISKNIILHQTILIICDPIARSVVDNRTNFRSRVRITGNPEENG
ncbi:hypothetical protein D3C80_1614890 [compost metagenome]